MTPRVLIIDGAEVNANFARAAANIDGLDVLPSQGANVYDILKRDTDLHPYFVTVLLYVESAHICGSR